MHKTAGQNTNQYKIEFDQAFQVSGGVRTYVYFIKIFLKNSITNV